jgi:hypothetical protein
MIEPNEPFPMTTRTDPNRSNTPSAPLLAVALLAVAYAIAYRLAPEWTIPNLSPIGALCLFSLAFYPARWGFLLPLGVMVVSDLTLYSWYGWSPFNLPVYLCFAVYGLAGLAWRTRPGILRLAFGTVGSGLVFFVITNFVVWLGASQGVSAPAGTAVLEEPTTRYSHPLIRYSRDLKGLGACYAMALPFYRNTLLGDLVFTSAFFGMAFASIRLVNAGRRLHAPVSTNANQL